MNTRPSVLVAVAVAAGCAVAALQPMSAGKLPDPAGLASNKGGEIAFAQSLPTSASSLQGTKYRAATNADYLQAEERSKAESERRRREWNDPWMDRPEQVFLRNACPRRRYLEKDVMWTRIVDKESYPVVNTNSPLYGFLGCRFGEPAVSWGDEEYIHLDKPFFGFPWIRHDPCPHYRPLARCDARLTFHAEGKSSVPIRRMKRLRDEFRFRYGVEFAVEKECDTFYFAEAFMDNEYRVGLFMTNYTIVVSGEDRIAYTLSFEVVNERCVAGSDRRYVDSCPANWDQVLHITNIARNQLEDEDKWTYRVAKGKSTEELLDEWIRTRDASIIQAGKSQLGMRLRWRKGDASVCTEWEAEDFCPFVGAFVMKTDPERQARLCEKLRMPDMFQPNISRKPMSFTVGQIFWDLIPGDVITWYLDDCRKKGTVCNDGEDGEYWDCIRKKMKSVEVVEKARPEDWEPTALTVQYKKRREEISREADAYENKLWLSSVTDFTPTNRAFVYATNFLNSCLHEQIPGAYRRPTLENVLDMNYPSRDLVRKKMKRREKKAFQDYQYALEDARCRILRAFFDNRLRFWRKEKTTTSSSVITDEIARIFMLSKYERHKYQNDRDWQKFEDILGREDTLLHIIPRHREKEKTIRDFTPDEISSIRSVLVTAKERPIDTQSCTQLALDIYEIMNAILNATTDQDMNQDLVACCCDLLAPNIENYQMLWVLHRLGLEDGENWMTWQFIQDVKKRAKASQSIKIMQDDGSVSVSSSKVMDKLDAMLDSEWARKCQKKW